MTGVTEAILWVFAFWLFGYGFYVTPMIAIAWVIWENCKLASGQTSEEPFTALQKVLAGFLCFSSPIVSGLIFYYSLKKKFPLKAKFANRASILAFCAELILWMSIFRLPGLWGIEV